jgi:hypothetical protein
MASIIPFEGGALPAYLQVPPAEALNDDLTAHAGAGFPVISIKGKVFATVRDGERKILPNPKDPDSPASHIDMVLVKANKSTSKVYYINGYTEGAEASKPDCFSNDGSFPDASSEEPQAKSCAVCKHNVWGTKVSTDGKGGKGKACQDSVRIAVASPGAINDPYLIRVPPSSIRALGEYGKLLKQRGVKYNMVLTRLSFDADMATPKLQFKPIGFLPEAHYAQVVEAAGTELVTAILGSAGVPVEPPDETPVPEAPAPAPAPVATKPPKAAKTPAETPKPPVVVEEEIDLDSLKFDD